MSSTVLLVTDQQTVEKNCREIIQGFGFDIQTVDIESLSTLVSQKTLVLIDAGSEIFDEDELLAIVGFLRALQVSIAVLLPDDGSMSSIEDILDILCPGLVARSVSERTRIMNLLMRRKDQLNSERFEYLTVSPRPNEIMAILSNGSAVLLKRPLDERDDGSDVSSISLAEDATTAVLKLSSGNEVVIKAITVLSSTGKTTKGTIADNGGIAEDIDGANLGARLKNLRLAAGLTQAELARRTGIHRPNIARVEAGRHTPSLETLTRLASAIGVSTTSILTGD